MQKTKIQHNLILWGGNHAGFISNGRATVDTMFQSPDLAQWLENKGYSVLWKEGVYLRLVDSADKYGSENSGGIKSVRVWRMNNAYPLEAKFLFLEDLRRNYGEPTQTSYDCIFEEEMGTENLETIFTHLSGEGATADFGYPLSISDVIELYDQEERLFFYVDRYNFVQIPFL